MTKMNKYVAEFLGTLFFLYVILAVVGTNHQSVMADGTPHWSSVLPIPIMVFRC